MNHYPGAIRFLLHLSGNMAEAEELAQETFIRAWQRLESFEGRSSFRTWLHSIAFREFATRRKLADFAQLPEEHGDPRQNFVGSLVGALAIERAIATLPDALRITFIVCHVQELSIKEASEILSVPTGTILSRLHSARERLRRQLAMSEIVCVLPGNEKTYNGLEGPHHHEMSQAVQ